jgi:hypothetical protein
MLRDEWAEEQKPDGSDGVGWDRHNNQSIGVHQTAKSYASRLTKNERVQGIARRCYDVLQAVEFVSYRTVAHDAV